MQEFLPTCFIILLQCLNQFLCFRVGSFAPPDLFAPRLSSNSEDSSTRMHTVDIELIRRHDVMVRLAVPVDTNLACRKIEFMEYIHESVSTDSCPVLFVLFAFRQS